MASETGQTGLAFNRNEAQDFLSVRWAAAQSGEAFWVAMSATHSPGSTLGTLADQATNDLFPAGFSRSPDSVSRVKLARLCPITEERRMGNCTAC